MPQTHFRLVLDPAYSFALEPGYTHTRHCHDFRISPGSLSETAYRDPLTGVVMLKPSYLTDDWYNNPESWWGLPNWNLANDFWESVYRTYDMYGVSQEARFISSVDPGSLGGQVQTLTDIGIYAINKASVLAHDVIDWTMQSKYELATDEGFVLHYQTMTDRFLRIRNWFEIQWADVLFHFSMDGTVEVYRYLNGLNNEPTHWDSFEIASPGEFAGSEGYFVFLPIPQYGLCVYHSMAAQRLSSSVSSAQSGVLRGHLVNLPHINGDDDTGGYALLAQSKVTMGVNRSLERMQHLFGFHRIRYPASGTFVDSIFDPGYTPSNAPTCEAGLIYSRAYANDVVSCNTEVLRALEPEAPFSVVEGHQQGKLKHTLTTSDGRYSPMLAVNNVRFGPVFSTRNTTPVVLAHEGHTDHPDKILRLEFSDDERGRFEGSATILAQTDELRKVIERGDMTFRLDKSFDGGATWTTHAGGLAAVDGDFHITFDLAGCYYTAKLDLADMYARFNEITQINQPAYDETTFKDCINYVLLGAAQPDLYSYPPEFDTLKMPPVQKAANFRFAPQMGEHGTDILHDILILARRQNREYRVRHEWATNHWIAERKPRDTSLANTWVLTPFSDDLPVEDDPDNPPPIPSERFVRIGSDILAGKFSVAPPEANLLQPFGLDTTDANKANRVAGNPIVNKRSISDPTHYDYLGRVRVACPMFAGLATVPQINKMARRVYDAACGRRIVGVVPAFDYIDDLKPLSRVIVRIKNHAGDLIDWDIRTPDTARPRKEDGSLAELVGFWVKRRAVVIDYQGAGETAPSVNYHLDTRWEGEVK